MIVLTTCLLCSGSIVVWRTISEILSLLVARTLLLLVTLHLDHSLALPRNMAAVVYVSTESEIIALEEAVRIEGLLILIFWKTIVAILSGRLATVPTSVTGSNKAIKQSLYNLTKIEKD